MAGLSREPGIICAGKDGERFVGYPLSTFSEKDPGHELDIAATFALFVSTDKIEVEITDEQPFKLYKITILNWDKYQSEYNRQKKYKDIAKQEELWEVREARTPEPDAGWKLPAWVPKPEWDEFKRLRAKMRNAPFTPRAQVLTVNTLQKLMAQGHHPADVLNQSIQLGYRGVFAIHPDKGGMNGHRGKSTADYERITQENLRNAGLADSGKPRKSG